MGALTSTVARYVFAIPFGIFGLLHLMGGQNMAGMVPSWIPGGVFWVYLTGLALMAAAVSIIIQKKSKTGQPVAGSYAWHFCTDHSSGRCNGC